MERSECTEALSALGFTALEAEVYAVLVSHSPATAYRIAQELGKAAANVYKAVESLERKGAVLTDRGDSRLYRAIAPDELMRKLQEEFTGARARASRALARLQGPGGDERIYQLRSREQVMARVHAMLGGAAHTVLCDLFPEPARELAPELAALAHKGLHVCVQLYQPCALDERIETFVDLEGGPIIARWPGQWLNVVVDARQHLLALLDPGEDGVHQAVWSESSYLSVLHHCGVASGMVAAAVGTAIAAGCSRPQIAARYAQAVASTSATPLPGYRALVERFAAPAAVLAAKENVRRKRRGGGQKS